MNEENGMTDAVAAEYGPDVAALRAAAEKATPGPWVGTRAVLRRGGTGVVVAQADSGRFILCDPQSDARVEDAEFIAAANPAAILTLLDRLNHAEAEAHNLEHEVDRVRGRLWKLAVVAGHVPCESDNDATAELVVGQALAALAAVTEQRDQYAAQVALDALDEVVRRLSTAMFDTHDYNTAVEVVRDVRRAALRADGGGGDLAEEGRRLASRREDLIAQGVDPAELEVPIFPNGERS